MNTSDTPPAGSSSFSWRAIRLWPSPAGTTSDRDTGSAGFVVFPAASPSRRRRALVVLITLAAVASAVWTLRDVDAVRLAAAASDVDVAALAAALASVQVANVAKALRWRTLLGRGPASLLLALIYVGQLGNSLLPARAGDLARAELLHRRLGADRATLLSTIAVEKLLDLVVLGLLAAVVLPFVPGLPALEDRPLQLAVLAAVVLVSAVVIGGWLRLRGARSRLARGVASLLGGARILRSPSALVGLAAWSLLAWLAGAVGNVFTLVALGVERPWLPALVLLIAIYAGMPIPSLPGRVGLHQAISLAALAPFALGDEIAVTTALIVYATSIVFPCLIGALSLYVLGVRLSEVGRPPEVSAASPSAR